MADNTYELDDEQKEIPQKLKAALYYTTLKISDELAEEKEVALSPQVMASVAEATWNQCQQFAEDLEMFAKHAKRSTITADDVILLTRRSEKLYTLMSQKHEVYVEEKQKMKKTKKPRNKKSSTVTVSAGLDVEEDSNMEG
ncbi:centromere protein S-like [Ostrea edulis]|uniref:centromere protein S-like n=1 Tax=Ostrea edulis TaxID=37623 RepID=UPI0024AF90E5|nr:centromere protein S-like [Ostrea edulis]